MKIIKETKLSNGNVRVTVELSERQTLMSITEGDHYKLGFPHEQIVPSEVIKEAVGVVWCCVEQKWIY